MRTTVLLAILFLHTLTTLAQPTKHLNDANERQHTLGNVRWTYKTNGKVFASPIIVKDVVFIGSEDQHLYAFDSGTGTVKWKFKTGGAVHSSVAHHDGTVYFGSFDGNYYALNADTGKEIWRYQTQGEKWMGGKGYFGMKPDSVYMEDPWEFYLSTPVVGKISDTTAVFFGSSDGNVYAVNAKTGTLVWKYKTGGNIHSTPCLYNNLLYIGSWDATLYAIDIQTGLLKWKFQTGQQMAMTGIQSSPYVANDMVYFGARDAHFYALDAATGTLKWKFFAENAWILATATSKDSTVYVGTSDSYLVIAFNAFTGKVKWKSQLNGYVFSSPHVYQNNLFVGDFTGQVYSLDVETGQMLNRYATTGHQQYAASVLNNGKLDFMKAADGKDLSLYSSTIFAMNEFYKLGPIVSSPVVHDDTLYVGSADGNIYAIALMANK